MIKRTAIATAALFIITVSCSLLGCEKESNIDCTPTTRTMEQNHTYTADQQGEVSATVNGCHGVYIYVNGIKAAGSTDYGATINTFVNYGETWKVTSSCTDAGVVVKYRTICN